MGGHTQEESLELLNQDLDRFYIGNKVGNRIPELQLTNILAASQPLRVYPILSGKGIKAANTRALVPWVRKIAEDFHSTHNPNTLTAPKPKSNQLVFFVNMIKNE